MSGERSLVTQAVSGNYSHIDHGAVKLASVDISLPLHQEGASKVKAAGMTRVGRTAKAVIHDEMIEVRDHSAACYFQAVCMRDLVVVVLVADAVDLESSPMLVVMEEHMVREHSRACRPTAKRTV